MEEGRTRRHGHGSPDRSRVRSEQTPPQLKQQQQQSQVGRKIPVVYYLCRNRHLEHPHFIEVPISSPGGLHLRDVINRLNVLRGKGMAAMYSWSCKRSYKSGFVWHDLSDDDLILPASENEYILKGSELLDSSPCARPYQSPSSKSKLPTSNPKQLQMLETQLPSHSQESSPCSSSIASREANQSQPSPPPPPPPPPPHSPLRSEIPTRSNPHEDELSPSTRGPSSSSGNASPASSKRNSSLGSDRSHSPVLAEFKVYNRNDRAVDASTQTEERARVAGRRALKGRETCARGISTDDAMSSSDLDEGHLDQVSGLKGSGTPLPPTSSSKSSFVGRTDTLESLIRAEARKMNSFRILEEEDVLIPTTAPKLKATNVLMQLITCGSISVKDHHSFGFVHTYRPRFSHANLPSPMFGGPLMVGDFDCFPENPRLMGLRLEDKEYFSGSILETKKLEKAEGRIGPMLKRSSSYNADRTCKSPYPTAEKERPADSSHSNCLPRAIKIATSKVLKGESMRSPISEAPRISSEVLESASLCTSKGSSKRFKDTSLGKGSSARAESFKEDNEKVIKIEESLLQELGL